MRLRLWSLPIWLLLFPISLPAIWPLLSRGLPKSFDGALHLLRLGLLDEHIRHGFLFPRWSPELLLGYGYPVFGYYAPSTYYLAELLHLVGLPIYHSFVLTFCLLLLFGGIGMYFFALDLFATSGFGSVSSLEKRQAENDGENSQASNHDVFNRGEFIRWKWPAFVAATAYMYAPYLLTNIYIRGALAEAGAMALLPWIFWSVRRLIVAGSTEESRRHLILVALFVGALACTHNITLLFVPFVILFYGAALLNLHNRWHQLRYLVPALALAMFISAFFWLPLILERSFLADTAAEISQSIWLPSSFWRWDNFLKYGFIYHYEFERPVPLGLVQVAVAFVGILLLFLSSRNWRNRSKNLPRSRWSGEVIFWLVIALICGSLIGAWAQPIWFSNEILTIAQFAWRLLSILSLPLALFAGGLVWQGPKPWATAITVIASLIIIVLAHQPSQPLLNTRNVYEPTTALPTLPVFAQLEVDKGAQIGGEGNSSVQEFRPRWTGTTLLLDQATLVDGAELADQVQVERANSHAIDVRIATESPALLTFNNFYFPGWSALLTGSPLPTQPVTNLGLLAVEVPSGDHTLQLSWTGTSLQWWASLASLLGLCGLIWLSWRAIRVLVLPLGLLALFGLVSLMWEPALAQVHQPTAPVEAFGIQLAGYQTEQNEQGYLVLHPYWYVEERPSANVEMIWQLRDEGEAVVTEWASRPYLNTTDSINWVPGSVVDDLHWVPLPAESSPASLSKASLSKVSLSGKTNSPRVYMLWLGIKDQSHPNAPAFHKIGPIEVTLPVYEEIVPQTVLNIAFDHTIRLAGYTSSFQQQSAHATKGTPEGGDATVVHPPAVHPPVIRPPVIRPNERVTYSLYWGADASVKTSYHSFLHLVDKDGAPLVQQDQVPGPVFAPSTLWHKHRLHEDILPVKIPQNASSGLYWPLIGLYNFDTVERVAIFGLETDRVTDHVRLPPMKVVAADAIQPNQRRIASFDQFASVIAYSLELPEGGASPGTMLTLQLTFQSNNEISADLRRFVQLYNPALGMAAQQDGPPQQGRNPTWSWVPGEMIDDEVSLTVDRSATPGEYMLYIGFYDPESGLRTTVLDGEGKPVAENWVGLESIDIR